MAGGLPPPPTRAASGDFAWTAWYNQLYTLLSTSGSVSWSLVNKAGSSIADLVTRSHNLLTGFQGGTTNEYYHLTAAQHAGLGAGNHNDLLSKQGGTTNEYYHWTATDYTNRVTQVTKTKAGAPTTSDITAGNWAIYKDTTAGTIKIYANDGGTIKASVAFT